MSDEERREGEQTEAAEQEAEDRSAEEARQQAGEQSLRPDIQGGALRMADDDEPQEHRHPSYREAADEEDGKE